MKLPKYGDAKVLARDVYGSKILLIGNERPGSFDFYTDGRILLTASVAERLAAALVEFANTTKKRKQ